MNDRPECSKGSGEEHSLRFRVGEFDGPLDLLLHLVRINEVDITDIPIVEIARQYAEYLELMRDMDLEVAGEYLVMAATLMHIKSRILLPAESAPEEGEQEDPRDELVRQLVEYQRFKQAAETLQAMDSARSLIWTKDGQVPEEFRDEEMLAVDLYDLIAAFRNLLGRLDEEVRIQLRRDDISVADKIGWLSELLERRGSVSLQELFEGMTGRLDRIATFLAVLEMLRLRILMAYQREAFGEIRVARRSPAAPDVPSGGEGEGFPGNGGQS